MRFSKKDLQNQQVCMSIYHEWIAIPHILKKKLIMTSCLILFILAAGIFMEWVNRGEGIIKLTIICIAGIGARLLDLFVVIIKVKYETIDGEIMRIQNYKKRRNYWGVTVRSKNGTEKQITLPVYCKIRKGNCYQFYMRENELLAIEDQESLPIQ